MILNEEGYDTNYYQKQIEDASGDKRADIIKKYLEYRFEKAGYIDDITPLLVDYIQDNNDKLSDYDNPIFTWIDNYNSAVRKGSIGIHINPDMIDSIHDALDEDAIKYNDLQNLNHPIYKQSFFKNNPNPDEAVLWLKTFNWLPEQKYYMEALKKDRLNIDDVFYNEDGTVKSIADIKWILQKYKDKIVQNGEEISDTSLTKYSDEELKNLTDDDIIKKANNMDRKSLIKLAIQQAQNIKKLKSDKE